MWEGYTEWISETRVAEELEIYHSKVRSWPEWLGDPIPVYYPLGNKSQWRVNRKELEVRIVERVRKENTRDRCSDAGKRNRPSEVSPKFNTALSIITTVVLTLLSLAGVQALLQVAYVVQAARWGWSL